jgi:hypothetical protein
VDDKDREKIEKRVVKIEKFLDQLLLNEKVEEKQEKVLKEVSSFLGEVDGSEYSWLSKEGRQKVQQSHLKLDKVLALHSPTSLRFQKKRLDTNAQSKVDTNAQNKVDTNA